MDACGLGVFRVVCVSCACIKSLLFGWWVWVRFWVGHKCYARGKHAVGFTFNTCWALSPRLLMLDGFLVLVVVWCVVCDLYSG